MNPIDFLYAIHNHQPVGNFGHVFEEAFEKCYSPQIEVLKNHPKIKMALHHSGPLLEWIEENRPNYLDEIGDLVDRGQIEILSGGFYEPILSTIPKNDAIGQIVMMNEYIKKRFGVTPTGMWTAERIWDPELPLITKEAGIKYTLLDDTHFYYAGMAPEDRYGYYVTEKHGATLSIFPIDMAMRYSIPFKLPEENIDYFRSLADNKKVDCVTYGDDGEKFGVWPETHEWVYGQKWLENFYTALEENSDVVTTTHYSDFLTKRPSKGRIYLPPASYEEMMEWTLPADASTKFHNIKKELSDMGKADDWKPFIRGGLWANFQTKYDESNRMSKKALYVSGKLAKAESESGPSKILSRARKELYKGQCNCAYWHGMFGGLYLNSLRHAVYSHLIKAEKIIDEVSGYLDGSVKVEQLDYDMDGEDDVIMSNSSLVAVFDPDYGGSMLGLDYRDSEFCLTNTLTRQKEAYHKKIEDHQGNGSQGDQPASIHDMVRMKEDDLADFLIYDKSIRRNFIDRFLPLNTEPNSFAASRYTELGDFFDGRYEIENIGDKNGETELTLSRRGSIIDNGKETSVTLRKMFRMVPGESHLICATSITNNGLKNIEVMAAQELNLTLLTDEADDRYWVGGAAAGQRPKLKETIIDSSTRSVGLADQFFGFEVLIISDPPTSFWRFPIHTVSQSESGFEKTYQGSCIVVCNNLSLPPGIPVGYTTELLIQRLGRE